MSAVEEFESLIKKFEEAGYRIRYDYFGGTGGGICQIGAANWLFIDLALSVTERLDFVRSQMESESLFNTNVATSQRAA